MFETVSHIRLNQVCKTFSDKGRKITALDHIDAEFKQGRLYAVEGPSGCGKSTLLAIIGCLEQLDSGTLFFDDTDVSQWNFKRLGMLRKVLVGHVHEKYNLLPALSVLENLALILRITNGTTTKEAIEHGEKLLEMLHLQQLAYRKPPKLSAGELKRASIGRAIIKKPWLFILDEPTANLDEKNVERVVKIIKEYSARRQGITIVVTHEPLLKQLADHRYRVRAGQIIHKE
jgi:putative ABC transport system ATP-binding protein